MSEFGWFTFRIYGDDAPKVFNEHYLAELNERIAAGTGDLFFNPDPQRAACFVLESGGVDFCGNYPMVLEEMYQRCQAAGLRVKGGGYAEDMERMRFSFDRDGKLEFASIDWMLEEPTAAEVRELHNHFNDMRWA